MTQTDSRAPIRSYALPPSGDRFYGNPLPPPQGEDGEILRRTLTLAEPPVHDEFMRLSKRRYLFLGAWSAAWFVIFALHGGYSQCHVG